MYTGTKIQSSLRRATSAILCARPRRFLNGMKAQGTPLGEAKVVFYGAGSSAVGVASMIARLIELDAKISAEDARKVWRPLGPD